MVADLQGRFDAPDLEGAGRSLFLVPPSLESGPFPFCPFQIVSLFRMLRTWAHVFVILTQSVVASDEKFKLRNPLDLVSEPDKEGLKRNYTIFQGPCEKLGLASTADQLTRLLSELGKPDLRYSTLQELVPELRRRLYDDTTRISFLHIPSPRLSFYSDSPQFGEKVADKFPKAVEDIQEAGKCFALARYTACVFHLMRVTETAVQYLGKRLGISLVSEKNWHNILEEVDKAIRKMPAGNSRQKALRNKFSQASAHLRMVKDAWRNDVMHPKETYTDEEAERVFRNVKDFMVHLAVKL